MVFIFGPSCEDTCCIPCSTVRCNVTCWATSSFVKWVPGFSIVLHAPQFLSCGTVRQFCNEGHRSWEHKCDHETFKVLHPVPIPNFTRSCPSTSLISSSPLTLHPHASPNAPLSKFHALCPSQLPQLQSPPRCELRRIQVEVVWCHNYCWFCHCDLHIMKVHHISPCSCWGSGAWQSWTSRGRVIIGVRVMQNGVAG